MCSHARSVRRTVLRSGSIAMRLVPSRRMARSWRWSDPLAVAISRRFAHMAELGPDLRPVRRPRRGAWLLGRAALGRRLPCDHPPDGLPRPRQVLWRDIVDPPGVEIENHRLALHAGAPLSAIAGRPLNRS